VYGQYGQPYNTTWVVDLKRGLLNLTAYQEYSPLSLPTTFTAVYSIAFALATSAIIHTALYHGHSIWDKIKNIKTKDKDVHAKLMCNYPEVPNWWYWSYFIVFTVFSVIMIEVSAASCMRVYFQLLKTTIPFLMCRFTIRACPSGDFSWPCLSPLLTSCRVNSSLQ
jgi:ammonia channel protein AmtB